MASLCSHHQAILPNSSGNIDDEQLSPNAENNYPKGKNPFGDLSSSEEDHFGEIKSSFVLSPGNPFGESCDSDSDSKHDSSVCENLPPSKSLITGKRPAPKPPVIEKKLLETDTRSLIFSGEIALENNSSSYANSDISDMNSYLEAVRSSVSDTSLNENLNTPLTLCRTSSENHLAMPLEAAVQNSKNFLSRPKRLSVSCDTSLHIFKSNFSKGPAPPLPPRGRRLIRTECQSDFIEYAQLRREMENLSDELCRLDSLLSKTKEKMKLVGKESRKHKKYMKTEASIYSKRCAIFVKQRELKNQLQRQLLEDRHADLEFELRIILSKQEHLRTNEEKQREHDLLELLIEIVEERAKLTEVVQSPTKPQQ